MIIEHTDFDGVFLVKPTIHKDDRGYFFESYRDDKFKNFGLSLKFCQENQTKSNKGTLRGLHYQLGKPQGKLVHVIAGAIKDVAVDIRTDSPDFGKSITINLDSKSHNMIFIPEGFAHGYLAIENNTIVHYKCTDYYDPTSEYGIFWNDKDLNIDWGVSDPVLSNKDSELPILKDLVNLPSFS